MERNGDIPKKLCFGNFDLRNGECKACPQKVECWDDQTSSAVGFAVGTVTARGEAMKQVEELQGLPDWVFEWDEVLTDMTEEEIQRFLRENPDRARFYNLLNSGIQD